MTRQLCKQLYSIHIFIFFIGEWGETLQLVMRLREWGGGVKRSMWPEALPDFSNVKKTYIKMVGKNPRKWWKKPSKKPPENPRIWF